MIAHISENLSVAAVLTALGIDHPEHGRMRCPVHSGHGPNFSISADGRLWTCHSRHCGEPHKRDGVNLFCLIRYGRALPDLDATSKCEAIRTLADLAGVDLERPELNRPRNRFERDLPLADRARLAELFANTTLMDGKHGHAATYESSLGQKTILFLAVARSIGHLPRIISHDWSKLSELENFLR